MDSSASAALLSWSFNGRVIAPLAILAAVYIRGWLRGRRLLRDQKDGYRLAAFLGGLGVLFIALESPLDVFDSLLLSAHMAQHLLLMMAAPPLLLLGNPALPLLRGLPKAFVKEGLGPFLTWPLLRKLLHVFVHPVFAWCAYSLSTIVWHVPPLYDLVLRSAFWHAFQHACFFWTAIAFWWPVVQPGPGHSSWPRWAMIPYLLLADITNTALSAFFIFSGQVLYPAYEALGLGGISARSDQATAGAIMWVPGSLAYLVPAIAIAVRLFNGRTHNMPPVRVPRNELRRQAQNRRIYPRLRRLTQLVMLLLAIAVVADGLFGTQVTPLNLAGVLPWIHWRALSIAVLLVAGNLFCMACPFTLVRDLARRVGLRPARRWPRILRTKWLSLSLFIFYLFAYEAFRLWDSPLLTAYVITGYFLAAVVIDGTFRGASFCKYVCPIGQFHFVNSLVSPREVSVRSMAVCHDCKTHDCIRGNERDRGCELYLFQPKKESNLDCTFCLDCVKACPHDNVALLPTLPAATLLTDPYRSSIGRLSKRSDLAAIVLAVVFGAFINAAEMVTPVMMWQHNLHARLGPHTMPYIVAAFVLTGVVALPLAVLLVCSGLNRIAAPEIQWGNLARRLIFALAPLGTAMWAAHLLYHFATSWRLLLMSGWLVPLQIILLDAGLLLTLYVTWRITLYTATRVRKSVGLMLPWASLACALHATGVWIVFQPMEMRGMLP